MSEVNEGRSAPRRVLTHLASMVAVSAILGVVVAGLAIPFAGVLGIGTRNVANSMNDLPESLETKALSQRTRILAADGTTIATLYDENRVNVSLNQVSRVMREAIVSIEDYRFYQHGALDVKGTLRALVTNKAAGGVVQGGSSITQQMVKLTLLSQAKTEEERKAAIQDTFARKVRELRYAIAFEQEHSKDWILERYLNIAYFGDGVYGIQAAARHYFSKDARKLNLRESAMLAGLVKNPVGLDPTVYPDRALSRRNVVLDRMAQLNVISQKQARKTGKRDLGLKLTPNRNGCMFSKAPFFCDYVVDYLKRDPRPGQDRRGPPGPAALRRPHRSRRPSTSASRRRPTTRSSPTSSRVSRPSAGWRWSSPAPATSAPWRSRDPWAVTRRPARPSSTTPCPRRSAVPAASRRARRSRRSCSPPPSSRASR